MVQGQGQGHVHLSQNQPLQLKENILVFCNLGLFCHNFALPQKNLQHKFHNLMKMI